MPKRFTHSLSTAAALLLLLTAQSALGAQGPRPATAHAAHRASHRSKAARRRHRSSKAARRRHPRHEAAVHAAKSHRTHKPPVKPIPPVVPISPVGPVSPVEPTPPIIPTPPTEPVVPVTPAPPAPAPPTASFTYAPTAPLVGQAVSFDGASSSCPGGPCTYEWSDDGTTTRPIPVRWPLGSGQTLPFTFLEAGTKYIRLVVTDAEGQTATVEHNVVVGEEPLPPPSPSPPPPPPSAPAVITMPAISGTATEGKTLNATTGAWTGSPSAYSYQWKHCNSSGRTCTNIGGAVTSSYRLASSDVGHKMSVMVTAANAGGSSSASSPMTAMVTAPAPIEPPPTEPPPTEPPPTEPPPTEPPPTEPPPANGAQQTGCFTQPSACGYPDATNTGVPAGTPLQAKSGKIVVTTPDTTVKDVALNGEIAVDANNTTIEDDEITIDGSQRGCSEPCNGHGIQVEGDVTGTVVKHVTCHGGSAEGENASEFCMKNYSGRSVNVSYMDDYNVGACWWGEGTYENNYCFVNAVIPEEHYEAIYYGGGKELKMTHNTMFSNKEQTAIVFASVDFHNQEAITLTNNFMAGGGFVIYGGGSGSGGRVIGPVTISDNRFARCLTPEVQGPNGHHLCKDGPDAHGFYPNGGSYGLTSYMNEAVTTYSGNYWDDNLEPVL